MSTHGTRACYVRRDCRRPECTAANTAYEAERLKDSILGRPRRLDATGTKRRVQALVAAGWPLNRLAAVLDWHPYRLRALLAAQWVTPATAATVRDAYDRLWTGPPAPTTRRAATDIVKAKRFAAERGWPVPMAWDDELLDDPGAAPTRVEPAPRPGCKLPDADGLLWLREHGWTGEEIAAYYGATANAVYAAIGGGRPGKRDRRSAEVTG